MHLVETDIRSDAGRIQAVKGDRNDQRPWIQHSPHCDLLQSQHILHLGVGLMPDPYRIVRTNLGGSYFLVTLDGEGRVLVDGKWQASKPGQAILLPPRTVQAFYTPKGKSWHFCWVRYQEPFGTIPIASANSPVLARYDGRPLECAILGLVQECSRDRTPSLMDAWVRIIHGYVQKFAVPKENDQRVWRTWERVANDLSYPWSIAELARESHMSEKQFQRLCRRDLGRSPQQQLMWLRMRRAAELLAEGGKKINTIASSVGYQNAFVFSTTFKRIMGWTPSEFPAARSSRGERKAEQSFDGKE